MACHSPPLDVKPSGRWECFRCSPYHSSEEGYMSGRETFSSRNFHTSESGISSQSSDLSTSSYGSYESNKQKLTNGSNPYAIPRPENRSSSSRYARNGTLRDSNLPENKQLNRRRITSPNSLKKSPSSSPTNSTSNTKRFLPILPPHLHPHTGCLPENWEDYEPDPNIPDVSTWDHNQIEEYFTNHGFAKDICQIFVDQVKSIKFIAIFRYKFKVNFFALTNNEIDTCLFFRKLMVAHFFYFIELM